MNKAITDGVQLTPPAFKDGLDVWSSGNGTPGSPTYDGDPNATLIAADADFGGCLELLKASGTQKLRSTGETPMFPGCYWRIRARVKAISGPFCSVRVAAWAGDIGGNHVAGLDETGSSTALTTYGEVIEVSAIVGSGSRTGVDLPWGQVPTIGHFGIDLTGANNGVVRIDDIVIEDVTSVFHGKKMDIIDVRDYGAVGDGVTDDVAAFEAADAAAAGRTVLVPEGVFYLASTVTINSEIRFHGTVLMPAGAILQLLQNFDYPTYFSAFGDEQLAFEKAIQAMFNFTDHVELDLRGRSIDLTGPVDVHAVVGNQNAFSSRRVIRNGQLSSVSGPNWDDVEVTATASYDPNTPNTLSSVTNINTVPVGALVTGTGVGREVYVRSKNTGANTITLSKGLWGAPGSQTYTFTRFQYQLDFSGFTNLKRFTLDNINFACNGNSSGVSLADDGLIFHVKDCYFSSPKDRGLTSTGQGCAGILLDRNQWLSSEQALAVSARTSIGFNVNAHDAKIRNNRAIRFKHWAVVSGAGVIFTGNHFFQDDPTGADIRSAGLVMASNHPKSAIVGNYVDNCFIDWTNEHDATPDIVTGFSFGGLTIDGNHFTSSGSASWFAWIQIKPHGTGHFINGLNISGNVFKAFSGPNLDRVDQVDTSIATLDATKYRNITIQGNTFNNIDNPFMNPVPLKVEETASSNSWRTDVAKYLPFQANARFVMSLVPESPIKNAGGTKVYTQPYFEGSKGTNKNEFDIKWSEAVNGKVRCTLRCDDNI